MAHPGISEIDFLSYRTGDAATRRAVAEQIGAACRDTGFFTMTTHGLPPALLDRTMAMARAFFDLPLDQRMDPAIRASAESPRGYVPLHARQTPETTAPLEQEALKFELPLPDDDPEILTGGRLRHRNKWPAALPALKAAILDYFAALTALSDDLLGALALSLGQREELFLPAHRRPLSIMSLIHYPPQPVTSAQGVYGVHPHTDAASFSALIQDDVGGLQVQTRAGEWIDVPPVAGSLVINIGDFMELWSNGQYRAGPHRVINHSGRRRLSIPYFAIPAFDTLVTPLPSCAPAEGLEREPLHIGQFYSRKWRANWVDDQEREMT